MANFNIDYLVVAGGGGGGGGTHYQTNSNVGGGGAGAGGLLTSTGVSLTIGASYTVLIGDGGAGGPWANNSNSIAGTSGSNSSLTGTGVNALADGGGGGGSGRGTYSGGGLLGLPGGSGGGSGFGTTQGGTATSGQGNNGGFSTSNTLYGSGGGGGAGGAGVNGNNTPYVYGGGAGGAGIQNSITGISPNPYYAGGGGAGPLYEGAAGYYAAGGDGGSSIGGGGGKSTNNTSFSGAAGATNTGSGGGGGSRSSTPNTGGDGGSGIVILRYATADIVGYTATGLTPTEDTTTISGQTILSFTTVGTGTIIFTAPVIPPFSGTRVTNPVTGFESPVDIGLKLPSGTNDNLPTAVQGMIRNDTSETTGGSASAIIHYNGADWNYFAATESADVPPSIFLDANNATSYPGTGTTWFDLTSNGNNGAITSANFVNSSSPYYFNFGSGKYVTTTYSLPTSGGVSIELWFNANSGVSSYMAGNNNASNALRNGIIIGDLTGSFPNESITFYQTTGLSTGANYVIFAVEEGNTKYQDGAWHQLLLIDTGSGHEVYVDGASKTLTYEPTAGGPGTRINWTNFSLSKVNWTTGGYMNGSIGQCSIYEKALTQSEVLASFNSTRNTYGI